MTKAPHQDNLWSRADLVQRMHRPAASTQTAATALDDVTAERQRQQQAEGWTPEHDDTHDRGEMATAARCYLAGDSTWWPWSLAWWKPKDRRRDLVRAGALAMAEIERLRRAKQRYPQSTLTKAALGLGLFAPAVQALRSNELATQALLRDILQQIEALDGANQKEADHG